MNIKDCSRDIQQKGVRVVGVVMEHQSSDVSYNLENKTGGHCDHICPCFAPGAQEQLQSNGHTEETRKEYICRYVRSVVQASLVKGALRSHLSTVGRHG